MKLRRKPVEIEGVQVKDILTAMSSDPEAWKNYPKWFIDWYEKGNILFLNKSIEVWVSGSFVSAGWEDWVLFGTNGEVYPASKNSVETGYEICQE